MKTTFDYTDSMTEQEYQDYVNMILYSQNGAGC